jgi:hypothetical protein
MLYNNNNNNKVIKLWYLNTETITIITLWWVALSLSLFFSLFFVRGKKEEEEEEEEESLCSAFCFSYVVNLSVLVLVLGWVVSYESSKLCVVFDLCLVGLSFLRAARTSLHNTTTQIVPHHNFAKT